VFLEFGPSRPRKIQIREDIRRWQPAIRTLLLVQITSVQYLLQKPLSDLPEPIAQAAIGFESDIAHVMRAMAKEVSGNQVDAVPDIRLSAARVQQNIRTYYHDLGVPVSPQASDVVGLAEGLASVLSPLYEDIHATLAVASKTAGVPTQFLQKITRS
jgi:multidrug resistance protein MdtO